MAEILSRKAMEKSRSATSLRSRVSTMTSSLLLATAAAVRLPVVPSRGAVAAPTRAAIRTCATANEFPRPYAAGGLKKSARVALEATDAECAALAKRFELEALGALAANVTLSVVDRQRQRVRAVGTLSAADVVRTAFDGARKTQQLDDVAFETYFISEDEATEMLRSEAPLDDDEAFDEEIDENGSVDLGELVAQHLYLYLDELAAMEAEEFTPDRVPDTAPIIIEGPEVGPGQ